MATFGTFVDGTTLKASELNDFLKLYETTITASQSVALTVASSPVPLNNYYKVNKLIFWTCAFQISSAGTASNAIVVNLPVTASSGSFRAMGYGRYFDASDSIKMVTVFKASTTTAQFVTDAGTSLTNRLGVNPAITAASGDRLAFFCMYEAA